MRTIVQHQTDAYLLTASSDRQARAGPLDDLRAALVVAVLAWFSVAIATGRGPKTAGRRRAWWQPVALFVVGSLCDAALAPQGWLLGPTLVTLWLAATAPTRAQVVGFALVAAACIGLTIASLAGLSGIDDMVSKTKASSPGPWRWARSSYLLELPS